MPPALLRNEELEWAQLTDRSVEVAATVGGTRLSLRLGFDSDGDIVHGYSQMRQRKVDGRWQTNPWGGEFRDYAQFGEHRLPTWGEAFWDLPEGRYVYWRGEVLSAPLLGPGGGSTLE